MYGIYGQGYMGTVGAVFSSFEAAHEALTKAGGKPAKMIGTYERLEFVEPMLGPGAKYWVASFFTRKMENQEGLVKSPGLFFRSYEARGDGVEWFCIILIKEGQKIGSYYD